MALPDDLPDPAEQQAHERAQLRDLEQRLRFPPILRGAPADKPVVYGYVRSRTKRREYVAACQDLLIWWCCEQDWHLSTVFTDLGVAADQVNRPGFAALLDVLMLPDSCGVVLVDPVHLSDERTMAGLLASAIRFTGARLLLLDKDLPPAAARPFPREDGNNASYPGDTRSSRQWWP